MPGRRAPDAGGKLKAVAHRWASGRGGSEAADDAVTQGAAAAIAAIEARRAGRRPASDELEIGPDETDAVTLFFSLGSQWTVHAMTGVRLGLDYGRIPATAEMMRIAMTPALFDDIGVMERAALAAWAQ